MSASADQSQLTCRKCGTPLQRGGQSARQCFVCLLESALGEQEMPTASAERFDHYQVATHPDGTLPVELGRGAMGVTFKAFDTVLGHVVALKVIDAPHRGPPRSAGTFPARSTRRRAASASKRRLGLLLRGAQKRRAMFLCDGTGRGRNVGGAPATCRATVAILWP